jgi:predicted Fe-Mo cluster-binding NifX family protein
VKTIAVPVWEGRISPVLDVASRLLVVESDAEGSVADARRREVDLASGHPAERAEEIAAQRVTILICGALSGPLEQMLTTAGVEVIPHICGPVEDVLHAYEQGDLLCHAFLMPGCCNAARRRRHGPRGRGGGGRRRCGKQTMRKEGEQDARW